MKDIIALAKEAGFYTGKNHIFGAGKGKDTYYSDGLNYIRVTDALNKLAALLEAEIRKEFEAELIKLKDEAKTARVEAECLAASCKSVTAQNAKLMEALKHCHEVFVKYEINRIDGDEISDKAISIIMEALTPQPEKE